MRQRRIVFFLLSGTSFQLLPSALFPRLALDGIFSPNTISILFSSLRRLDSEKNADRDIMDYSRRLIQPTSATLGRLGNVICRAIGAG
jgi:hypothetical protein